MRPSRRLSILIVACPFPPVRLDPVGGAEQILARLDRALVDAGHRSTVVAAEDSAVAGRLSAIPVVRGVIDATERARRYEAVRRAMSDILARETIDLVHLHGLDFFEYLPTTGVPVLVTLHLPLH